MSGEEEIQRFRKMAEADAENELGHFSLGKALLESGREQEAVAPLEKAISINPGFSRAYQLLGKLLMHLGRTNEAGDVLYKGFRVAAERGDIMPRDAMGDLLRKLGKEPPAVSVKMPEASTIPEGERVQCVRCGKVGRRLEKAPFPTPLGGRILDGVCRLCWEEWMAMGTKVINELRLDLVTAAGSAAYDQHMIEFLNLKD